jgi:hypothetical protein
MQAYAFVSPKQQDLFLLKILRKREDENRMIKLMAKNKKNTVFFRFNAFNINKKTVTTTSEIDEPVTVTPKLHRNFSKEIFTRQVLGAMLTCVGGSAYTGALLMARLLGTRYKEAAERGMIDAGSIVKQGDEHETIIRLPRQYYTEEHFLRAIQPAG